MNFGGAGQILDFASDVAASGKPHCWTLLLLDSLEVKSGGRAVTSKGLLRLQDLGEVIPALPSVGFRAVSLVFIVPWLQGKLYHTKPEA